MEDNGEESAKSSWTPHRTITGRIVHVALASESPHTKTKRTAVQQKGLRYEKKIVRELKRVMPNKVFHGQWLRYQDASGKHYAQPDLYTVFPDRVLLFECKLTQNDGARPQCLSLYAPLLTELYSLPVISCQVFHNLRYVPENGLIKSWGQLLSLPIGFYNWHNIGET